MATWGRRPASSRPDPRIGRGAHGPAGHGETPGFHRERRPSADFAGGRSRIDGGWTMGLDSNGVELLLYGRRFGFDLAKTAMIGRLGLHLSPAQLRESMARFSLPIDEDTLTAIFDGGGYAEGLLR